MYSFMTVIVIVVVGITAGTSYLIADYFFRIKEDELAQKGHEMAGTVEYFVTKDNKIVTPKSDSILPSITRRSLMYVAKEYLGLEVLDRVGIGDSFASGFVYGLMTTGDPEIAVNYGTAHGALVMTTPGDTSMAGVDEIEAVMAGAGARGKR